MKDTLGATAALIFIAQRESFPLAAELMLVPSLVFLGGLLAVAQTRPEGGHRTREGICRVFRVDDAIEIAEKIDRLAGEETDIEQDGGAKLREIAVPKRTRRELVGSMGANHNRPGPLQFSPTGA